jgi:hypothetical protein
MIQYYKINKPFKPLFYAKNNKPKHIKSNGKSWTN